MWLLDTTALKLYQKNFAESDNTVSSPFHPYAILSHTWGEGEVLFDDVAKSTSKNLRGYSKVEQSCALARSQSVDSVWIDTCCINKSSSAELSEAINSMYSWYRRARVCYVYLSDFSFSLDQYEDGGPQTRIFLERFRKCRWFRRGWTLQELLAPFNVEFYDKHWHYIGDKVDLADQISAVTGINQRYIVEWNSISNASVAARMSWVSYRETTRLEDQAYCLMGLFGVNMPLLYGEGHNAFLRLQHEIAKTSDDESLFAWHGNKRYRGESDIFADHPACFMDCGRLVPVPSFVGSENERAPYTVTNKGLAIAGHYTTIRPSDLDIRHLSPEEEQRHSFLLFPLWCVSEDDPSSNFTIVLKNVARNTFVRYHSGKHVNASMEASNNSQMIYIRQPIHDTDPERLPKGGWHQSIWITPHEVNRRCYALKDWRNNVFTTIVPSPYEWKIGLGEALGCQGYAVLLFKGKGLHVTTAVLDFAFPYYGRPEITLRAATETATFADTGDAYAKRPAEMSLGRKYQDDLKVQTNQDDQEIQMSDGTTVFLKRVSLTADAYRFVLGILAPPARAFTGLVGHAI
ncbi:MAG: hypothetical protein Q9168_006485 [Polycauliona sp. 1 TL-2023]